MESTDSSAAGAAHQPQLPPGFRFHPTDEELVVHYLKRKAQSAPLPVSIIAEVDLYKFDPWELPAKAVFGEQEWYFFSPRDRKYPNGARPNRAATSGYWKATGTDKPVVSGAGKQKVGVKKALVFYGGKPPRGVKTNWIMHEYRLVDTKSNNKPPCYHHSNNKGSLRLDDWVLCRIYKKNNIQRPMDREREDPLDDMMVMGPISMSIPSSINTNNNMGHHHTLNPKTIYNSLDHQGMFDGMVATNHGMDPMTTPASLTQLLSTSTSNLPLKRILSPPLHWSGNTHNTNGVSTIDNVCGSPSPSKRMSLLQITNNNDNDNNNSEESGAKSNEHHGKNNSNNDNNNSSISSLLNHIPTNDAPPLHQPSLLGSLPDGVFRHPYPLPGLNNWFM